MQTKQITTQRVNRKRETTMKNNIMKKDTLTEESKDYINILEGLQEDTVSAEQEDTISTEQEDAEAMGLLRELDGISTVTLVIFVVIMSLLVIFSVPFFNLRFYTSIVSGIYTIIAYLAILCIVADLENIAVKSNRRQAGALRESKNFDVLEYATAIPRFITVKTRQKLTGSILSTAAFIMIPTLIVALNCQSPISTRIASIIPNKLVSSPYTKQSSIEETLQIHKDLDYFAFGYQKPDKEKEFKRGDPITEIPPQYNPENYYLTVVTDNGKTLIKTALRNVRLVTTGDEEVAIRTIPDKENTYVELNLAPSEFDAVINSNELFYANMENGDKEFIKKFLTEQYLDAKVKAAEQTSQAEGSAAVK